MLLPLSSTRTREHTPPFPSVLFLGVLSCVPLLCCSKWCRRLQRVKVFLLCVSTFCLVWSIIRPFFGLELFFFQNPKLKKVQILSQKKRKREENDHHHHKAHKHTPKAQTLFARTDGEGHVAENSARFLFLSVLVYLLLSSLNTKTRELHR